MSSDTPPTGVPSISKDPSGSTAAFVSSAPRLTYAGARQAVTVAVAEAVKANIAISCCVVDAGGHVVAHDRMDGGKFHTLHSSKTKAACAASTGRSTSAKGAVGQELDLAHALGLALAAGTERWTSMEGGVPILVGDQCIGGIGISGGDWETDQRIAQLAVAAVGANWR